MSLLCLQEQGASQPGFSQDKARSSRGQGQLHKTSQAPSHLKSTSNQPGKANQMAETKVQEQGNLLALCGRNYKTSQQRIYSVIENSRQQSTQNLGPDPIHSVPLSQPHLLKVGPVFNKEGLLVIGECSLPCLNGSPRRQGRHRESTGL